VLFPTHFSKVPAQVAALQVYQETGLIHGEAAIDEYRRGVA
jgi:hypothetical protein